MYYGERFNSITHLLGAIAAAAGLIWLVWSAVQLGDMRKLFSFTVYGVTLLLLYLASTLYHSVRGRSKALLQKVDHFAIYLLIAGSYTPFTLVTLNGAWGWSLFGVVWGLALTGILIDAFSQSQRRIVPMIIYLLMGWLIVVAFHPLSQALPVAGVVWLVVGGLFYSGGILFYLRDGMMRHAHGIWHLFVLAGSVSHYIAVAGYVA